MFKRKLIALNYHAADNFNTNDEKQFRNLVLWLENQKIRHYKIEDRKGLTQIESKEWDNAFKKYLKDIAYPVKSEKRMEILEWLLGFAVRLEYADDAEKYNNKAAEKNEINAPKVISNNPLDNLNFESEEFKSGVNTLADMLKVTKHPDHLVTLKAISQLVCQRLTTEALENPSTVIVKGKPFPFQDADLGFDTGDYVLNQAAKILRLLYIHDLRTLQTSINECIVSVQSITANPKTDTKLGKVGK